MPVRESTGFVTRSDGSQATVVRLFGMVPEAAETQLVAAVTGRKIRVLSYKFMASDGAVPLQFTSGDVPGNVISGSNFLAANSGVVSGYNPHGHFETAQSEALNLKMTSEALVTYEITYITV